MQPPEDDDYISLDEITPQIWIGNYWAAYDTESLKRVGSILNLMSQDDERGIKPWLERVHGDRLQTIEQRRRELRIEAVRLVDDHGNELRRLRLAIDIVDELVRGAPPVLVHCRAGRGRSPAVVAGYFIVHGGLTAKKALERVAQKRGIYMGEEGGKQWVVNFLERLEDEARP
jgi:dual specificity phosphatase 12